MSFSTSQKTKLLLQFTFLVTTVIDSGGILDSSVLVDGHTAKQRYFHTQQAQTQQFFHSLSNDGKLGTHAQGITHFTSEKLPLLSAASSQRVLRELATCLLGICWPPPLLELPCRNTQNPVQNLLTVKNISNYNSYYTYLMTVCLQNFIRSYAYFMQRAASC